METKHTPLPWKMSDRWHVIVDGDGKWVADTVTVHRLNDEELANTQLIVRAVNSHDLLVEAVKSFIEYDSSDESDGLAMMISYNGALKKCKAALAAAEAK